MEKVSKSLAETEQIAKDFLAKLKPNKTGATVVTLAGDLGSGKTTFTQAVARTLGVRERVTSPTFVIMKIYPMARATLAMSKGRPFYPWKSLIHIDCYRLESQEDLLHLGWDELATDPANLILVEWPERVGDLLSFPTLKIKFEVTGETSRKIIYG